MNISNFESKIFDINVRKEYLLLQIGSTWLLDGLHIYLVTLLGTIGFFLNIISYWAFCNIRFHKRILKSFMKVYTLNASVCCLFAIFNFTARSPRYVETISFSNIGGFFRCKSTQIVVALYFFGSVLDCLILLERLSNFVQKISNIFIRSKSTQVISISFFLCILISCPFLFDYEIRSRNEFYDAINNLNIQMNEKFTFCGRNPFFQTLFGIIIFGSVITIRDFITLIIEIVLSISSIILFKRYLNNKKKFIHSNQQNMHLNHGSIQNQHVNINTTNITDSLRSNLEESTAQSRQLNILINRADKFNTNLTKMTLYLTFCSILLHLIAAIITIFLIANNNSFTAHVFVLIIIGAYHLKFISNFFFFYRFNNNFKLFFHFLFTKKR
jgi:hypothetical protein